ncbi:MAG: S8 family serine peptidase [Bacteroidales bacterium]
MKVKTVPTVILLTLSFHLLNSFSYAQDKISDNLIEKMAISNENEPIQAIIILEDQYPVCDLDLQLYRDKASLQVRAYTVIATLQEHAESTQKELRSFINSKSKDKIIRYKSFWITNLIVIEATKDILIEISHRPDIAIVDLDESNDWIDPIKLKPASKTYGNAEDNLKVINAHKMWAAGFTGEGVIVSNLDTGVDGDHPALSSNWHGNNVPWDQAWIDPFQGCTSPCDPEGSQAQAGHGTATMGVIAGLDPVTSDTIGVAFNASWIACRAQFGTGDISQKIECMEWLVDPDGNPSTIDDMPVVFNNSWGHGGGPLCSTPYDLALQAIEAAGIAVIWAAGNSGPGASTIIEPANQNHSEMLSFSVGGIWHFDPSLPVDPESSRGPTPCNNGTGNNIKPEITAPIACRTCDFNGEYAYWKGTSFAAPHVCGAIALLKEAFPEKTGSELKWMLYGSAIDLGIPGEDNDYGMGVLDIWAAYQYQPIPENPRRPMSVNAYSDYSTPGFVAVSWTDPTQYISGLPLTDFEIQILRDGELISTVPSGNGGFLDGGLVNGQLFEYQVIIKDTISENQSIPVSCLVYSGGSPFPAPPDSLVCVYTGSSIKLEWNDPVVQSDGTYLDDLEQILIYRNDILIDSVDAGIEIYYDEPLANFTSHYSLVAKDNESPANYSNYCDMVPCFAGDCPEYLVWAASDLELESKFSGDSIYNTLIELYRPAFLTNNLFEFGTDMNQYEVIFAVLGNYPFLHVLADTGGEAPALENFLNGGGKLYLEGGFAFDPFITPWLENAYDIHDWFGLGPGNEGSGDVHGIIGQNQLSEFNFDYIGINSYMNELNPVFSTTIWKNSENEDICGVFYDGFGSGKAIGVTTPFGSLRSDNHTKKELMEAYFQLFGIVISGSSDNIFIDFNSEVSINIYPNPINQKTSIEWNLPQSGFVRLSAHNILGKEITTLIAENLKAGPHIFEWQVNNMDKSVYFIRLETNEQTITKKVILLE